MSHVKVKIANKRIDPKIVRRLRRKRRIRGRIKGTNDRPRITIFRSNKHFSVQAIDDVAGKTLASVSSYEADIKAKISSNVTVKNVEELGSAFAKRLKEKNINTVVFDRNGYKYHGIIKAFADSLRKEITF